MLQRLLDLVAGYYHEYAIVFWVIGVILAIIAWNKPKESFKFAIFLLIMACILYAVGLFGESIDTGSKNREEVINKTKKMVE